MADSNDNMKKKMKKTAQEKLPFGLILSRVMKDRGLTLKHVAEMAGVSISVVNDWTSGTSPHNIKAVAKLARSLGMSLSGLLLGEPEEIHQISSLDEIFEETELFDGLCRISVKKLKLRKDKG